MTLRVCLVTPYAWDRPHEGNDHVAALASRLAQRGHSVVVLAPAARPAALRDGRARLRMLERGVRSAIETVAGQPLVITVGQPSRGMPTLPSVAAAVRRVLSVGAFDLVDALDPDIPGPSAAALRDSPAPVVATFLHAGQRRSRGSQSAFDRLAPRAAVVVALSDEAAAFARERLSQVAARIPPSLPSEPLAHVAASARAVLVECPIADRAVVRPLLAEVTDPTVPILLARTTSLAAATLRALVPGESSGRVDVVDATSPEVYARALASAAVYVAHPRGSARRALEAAALGVAVVAVASTPSAAGISHDRDGLVVPAGQPALLAASVGRLLADEPLRARLGAAAAARVIAGQAAGEADREALYAQTARPTVATEPAPGALILCDFHMHTEHSSDCATPVAALVDRAVALGLGAIAVTDHNTIAGGVAAAREVAERGLDLHVIVGSEVKTATGEVIGLYLTEEIPRGMPFADTIEAIHAQGGVVYVPHPFDRLHSICDPALLRRLADEIDVVESCNGRLYREAYNHEAAAFAQRHGLLHGAGSDAHVLEGLGSAAVRLPRFDSPESLLVALGRGTIERRPVSVAYVQALKWVRQARKRRGGGES